MELRVVSLPPTMRSIRLPRNSMGSISRVAGSWASMDIKSNFGGASARSFQSLEKYSRHSIRIAARSSSDIIPPTLGPEVDTSDQ